VAGVWIAGRPVREMVLTGLALAFATIPEELPILVTLVLGVGSYRLARRHAIVKHLRAAETLGAVSVVATDKTGTLTAQRLRAVELVAGRERCAPADAARTSAGRALLEAVALANDASIVEGGSGWTASGDPTAVALLDAARDAGVDVPALRRSTRVLREMPFDHRRQRASAVVEDAAGRRLVVAGAPEEVLGRCARIREGEGDRPLDDAERAAIGAEVDVRAAGGLRILAAAERRLGPDDAGDRERELSWLGIVALDDPPRPGATEAVAALRSAGVRVLMVTGDHPATAAAVAARVGIDASRVVRGRELDAMADADLAKCIASASVFARIAPEHKLRIVGALQDGGAAVAVTGDGVNDAPALRAAAVGVAMGRTGTQVAREAAHLVLADDDFATVVEAVRTGRVLFGNLRKAVRYYLAAKAALVLASLAAVLAGLPVPFAPVQIVLLELFLDLGASVTFVAEPPEDDVMAHPPRAPRARFVDRAMVAGILGGGLSLGGAVLLVYGTAIARGAALAPAQTAAFVTWMIGHVVLAAHLRTERQPLLRTRPLANRAFAAWAVAAAVAVGAVALVPPVGERLHAAPFDPGLWPLAIGAALLLPSWWEPWKWARRRAGRRPGRPNGASMP
jgi:Ca2+-transporting ATPase